MIKYKVMSNSAQSIFTQLVTLSIDELTNLATAIRVHASKARYCLLDPNRNHPDGVCGPLSLYQHFIVTSRIALSPHKETRHLLDRLQHSWDALFDALREELDLSPICDKAHTLQKKTHTKFVTLVFDPEWHTDGHELDEMVDVLSALAEEFRAKISKAPHGSDAESAVAKVGEMLDKQTQHLEKVATEKTEEIKKARRARKSTVKTKRDKSLSQSREIRTQQQNTFAAYFNDHKSALKAGYTLYDMVKDCWTENQDTWDHYARLKIPGSQNKGAGAKKTVGYADFNQLYAYVMGCGDYDKYKSPKRSIYKR